MTSVIARVTCSIARAPLTRLLTSPLGLDEWEMTRDHGVLQADEVQAGRLETMVDVLRLHSYSQFVLYPWGRTDEAIEDEADLSSMRRSGRGHRVPRQEGAQQDLLGAVGVPAVPDDRRRRRLESQRARRLAVHDQFRPASARESG